MSPAASTSSDNNIANHPQDQEEEENTTQQRPSSALFEASKSDSLCTPDMTMSETSAISDRSLSTAEKPSSTPSLDPILDKDDTSITPSTSLFENSLSNLSASDTNRLGESWQTGATRKKRGGGSAVATKKYRDPLMGGGSNHSSKSASSSRSTSISRVPGSKWKDPFGTSNHSTKSASRNGRIVSSTSSSFQQHRRTNSVPADINVMASSSSRDGNKKLDVREMLGLSSTAPTPLKGNRDSPPHPDENQRPGNAKQEDSIHTISRRTQFRRTASVPVNLTDMTASSPIVLPPKAQRNLNELLDSSDRKAPLLMNDDRDNSKSVDDDDGDSTIEESWRPIPEKRRILSQAAEAAANGDMDTPMSNKTSLDNFLDALIFDTKKTTNDDPEQHSLSRRRRRGKHHSSAASVGSALDRPTIMFRKPHNHGGGHASGAATVHGGERDDASARSNSSRTSGVLWARKGKARNSRPGRAASHDYASKGGSRGLISQQDSGLSAFLERESKHGRPSAAHSVAGDRIASGAISIVLSEDGKSKTYTVGSREAKLVEKLLQATNEIQSPKPITSTKSMKGWLEQVAGNLKSPSGHSDIQNSARVSTRSSLAVELSPPFEDAVSKKKTNLTSYLEKKRGGRDKRTSAFTVAGDRVSNRFQGKSTKELLQMLDSERRRKKIPSAPPLTGSRPRRQHSHTGETHMRITTGELANMKFSGGVRSDLHSSMPAISFDPFDVNDDDEELKDSDRLFPRTADAAIPEQNRKGVQSMLDGRRPNHLGDGGAGGRRARSTTPTKARNKLPRDFFNNNERRSSSTPRAAVINRPQPSSGQPKERLGDSLNAKDLDLEDFRPPPTARPTNRRSMMRKMHSVPILSDTDFGLDEPLPSRPSASRNLSSDDVSRGSQTRKKGGKKKKSRSNASETSAKSASKKDKKRSTSIGSKSQPTNKEADAEMDFEELNKSFLDKFLDGDVEAHDSASQINNPESPVKKGIEAKEAYKASLLDAPIENSSSKLRIEPDFLESTNRIILQDPAKPASRRDMLKKMKSVPSMSSPSEALTDLYHSPVVEPQSKAKLDLVKAASDDEALTKTPRDDEQLKSPLKSPKKKASKPKSEKKKKSKSNATEATGGDDVSVKKSKSNDDEPKSPSKKKKSKNKKLKDSKEGKKGKDKGGDNEKKARRNSGRHKNDEERSVRTASPRRGSKPKPSLEELGRQKEEKKPEQKRSRSVPPMLLPRSTSWNNKIAQASDVRSVDEADRILAARMNDEGPGTPNSERGTLGEKQLRKGRKPRNPNLPDHGVDGRAWKSVFAEPSPGLTRGRRPASAPRAGRVDTGSPKRSPRRGTGEFVSPGADRLPHVPFMSTERSEGGYISEGMQLSEAAPMSLRAVGSVSNYQVNPQGLKPALKRDEFGNSPQPQSPRRYSRPIPTVGRENTVLECVNDDDSVVSDITDQFSMDINEADIRQSKAKPPDLDRIKEPDGDGEEEGARNTSMEDKHGGSWGDLSHSHKESMDSRDRPVKSPSVEDEAAEPEKALKSRRWSSMKDLSAGAPKTPIRAGAQTAEDTVSTKTPTRLGWLKKKLLGTKKK